MSTISFGPFIGEIHISDGIGSMRVYHIGDPETTLTTLDLFPIEYVGSHMCVSERFAGMVLVHWITHGDTDLCDDLRRFFNNSLYPNYRSNRASSR